MPFWCVGSPVRMAEREGLHEDTAVKALANMVLRAASASMFGDETALLPKAPISKPPSSTRKKSTFRRVAIVVTMEYASLPLITLISGEPTMVAKVCLQLDTKQ
jgi:hypothetical protein